jgi:hypothetical protein
MNHPNFKKEQIKKIALSATGFVFLLYIYFNFFLGPLNRSRNVMTSSIKEKRAKLDSSKDEMSKATTLEQQAKAATTRFAQLKALNSEGAPIAWFPPRMKAFFANQQIDKAVARLENSIAFKEPELASWMKYNWLINLPQGDYTNVGKAVAALENSEPLLSITKVTIRALPDQPEFQQVDLLATNIIQKK